MRTFLVASWLLASTLVVTSGHAEDGLFVYCCAGFRPPIEAAAAAFSQEHGIEIELTYAGSGCLIAQAELAGRGDLFLPGEEHYITKAQERGLVRNVTPVAYLRPVISVRRGNRDGIRELSDLARPGLRVGLGDPRSVAVGVASERWFAAALPEKTIAAILANTTTRAINVNELGNQLALGGIDAAIVWDVTVPLFQGLEAIVTEDSRDHRTVITGGVLGMSKNPELAEEFLHFLTAPEGREILRAHGYEPYELDPVWEPQEVDASIGPDPQTAPPSPGSEDTPAGSPAWSALLEPQP